MAVEISKQNDSQVWRGLRLSIPVIVASAPFGVLFGAIAAQQGLSLGEITLMSATIFGGASQMVGLDLFGQRIPAWVIVLSIFAVNFRHVLYSAAVGRHITHWPLWKKALGFFFLVDPVYAESERRIEQGQAITFAWYVGIALPTYVMWVLLSVAGGVFGARLPDTHTLGLDFLLPIYFLGLVMSFRKRPLWLPVVLAAGIVSILAYNLVGSPWHVSIGAAAGVALAAVMAKPHPPRDPEPDTGDLP